MSQQRFSDSPFKNCVRNGGGYDNRRLMELLVKIQWVTFVMSALAALYTIPSVVYGENSEKNEAPKQKSIDGKTLILNGTGMREATIFKVDVYQAALYLEKKSSVPQEILNSPGTKHLDLRFVRDVDKDSIRDAWEDGYKQNCQNVCGLHRSKLKKLNNYMTNIASGQILSFTFLPNGMQAKRAESTALFIPDSQFSKIILSIWLGNSPPNEALKSGLLGKDSKQ